MPGFSFSAPIITDEQERAERQALTKDQLRKLHMDAFGFKQDEEAKEEGSENDAAGIVESEEMLNKARQMIREAIESTLSDDDKREYLEAQQLAPDLVESESDPAKFFRCEDYNVWAAAKRLAYYWKGRYQLFGPSKAFLPMTLAGAMADDVQWMDKGVVFSAGHDCRGRPVNVFCLPRTHKIPHDAVVRIMMYVLTTQAASKENPRHGYVALHRLQGYDPYKHSDRMLSKKIMMCVDGAPIKAKITHMRTGSGRIIRDVLLPVFKHIIGIEHRLRLKFYAGTDEESAKQLRTYGLSEDQIQILLGPTEHVIAYSKNWVAECRAMEAVGS